MHTLLTLLAACFCLAACGGSQATALDTAHAEMMGGGSPTSYNTSEPAGALPVDQPTAPRSAAAQAGGTIGDQLGVNFTWAADKLITGNPEYIDGAFKHVRYFQLMEKDFGEGNFPGNTVLLPCTDYNNPWSCPEPSMRQHLVRVVNFRKMFPDGVIWIAPAVYGYGEWPCKGYTVDQLGANPEEAGYNWGRAAFATYEGVGGRVVVSFTNEEWCAGDERAAAYNEWRRGIIRAHRENPSVELAVGARHVRPRMWKGERLNDNVNDVAPDIWEYVDSVGGWADYHAHGIEGQDFLPHNEATTAEDYRDFFAWTDWVQSRYPNIQRAVGEIAYTTSKNGVNATAAQKQADWRTYSGLIEGLAKQADIIFLYQIEDQPWPEGAFSGSGVFPELKDSVKTLGAQPRMSR